MTKLKVTELKKELKELEQKELINIIVDLYKINKDAQNYLSLKFNRENVIEDLYFKTLNEIKNEFFPERGEEKLRLSVAKNSISSFKKLTNDLTRTVDLMLYYVEVGTEFTNAYGDIDDRFYDSMISMYDKVVAECEKDEKLFDAFKKRLYSVIEASDGIGWGYHDGLCDIYYSISYLTEEKYK